MLLGMVPVLRDKLKTQIHQLDDVHVTGSKFFAPPTAVMFECLNTKPVSYELGDSCKQFCYTVGVGF